MANPEYKIDAFQRPDRGSAKLDRQLRRRKIEHDETENKKIAKRRDGKCRLPFCPWCATFKTMAPDHAAHCLAAKGQGGDPSLLVSQPQHLMRLCPFSHAAQENHDWAVEPLTPHGTNDVCAFYILRNVIDQDSGHCRTERVLWALEKRIGIPESAEPLTDWTPIRAPKARD